MSPFDQPRTVSTSKSSDGSDDRIWDRLLMDCFLTRHAGVIWLLGGEVKGALPFSRRSGMINAATRHQDVRRVKFDGISTHGFYVRRGHGSHY